MQEEIVQGRFQRIIKEIFFFHAATSNFDQSGKKYTVISLFKVSGFILSGCIQFRRLCSVAATRKVRRLTKAMSESRHSTRDIHEVLKKYI